MPTLEQAMTQSEANSASNFGLRGWIVVDGRKAESLGYVITTEDRPYDETPRTLEAVKQAVRLFNSETWEPYDNFHKHD